MPRAVCARCGRPQSACWCAAVPEACPLETSGVALVLQHPSERKRPLTTAPLLPACVSRCAVLTGRRLPPWLADKLNDPEGAAPVLLLYPGDEGLVEDVTLVGEELRAGGGAAGEQLEGGGRGDGGAEALLARPVAYVLLALDGTWKETREVLGAVLPQLPRARLVQLPPDKAAEVPAADADLRVEPKPGCLLTAAAVAAAVSALEGDGGAVARAVAAPLQALMAAQRKHDPAMQSGGKDPKPAKRQRLAVAAVRKHLDGRIHEANEADNDNEERGGA